MTSQGNRTSFRAALRKGRGCALQSVRAAGRLVDEDAVLDACLHNRVYDPQVEGSRVPWLLEILGAAGAADAFEAPILAAMAASKDYWDAVQFCAFAVAFARRGSAAARAALYRLFETCPFPDSPELGGVDIIHVDGIEGLIFVAKRHGAALRRGQEPAVFGVASEAEDFCGAESVRAALALAASGDDDIRAFNDELAEVEKSIATQRESGTLREERIKSITPQELFDAIDHRTSNRSLGTAWGRIARDDQLDAAALRLTVESDPMKHYDYLRIFWRRPYAGIVPHLVGMFDCPDEKLRRAARNALAQNRHPAVRALALARISAGAPGDGGVRLLIRNYELGDHLLIEKILPAEGVDEMQLHHLCFDLVDVFRENGPAECAGAMRFVYERTTCSACRHRAVELLLAAGAATPALIEECRYDCDLGTRDLVAGF